MALSKDFKKKNLERYRFSLNLVLTHRPGSIFLHHEPLFRSDVAGKWEFDH